MITTIFSINSEAFASELIESIEEMFPLYYMHSVICMLKSSTTPSYDNRSEGVNNDRLVSFVCFLSFRTIDVIHFSSSKQTSVMN